MNYVIGAAQGALIAGMYSGWNPYAMAAGAVAGVVVTAIGTALMPSPDIPAVGSPLQALQVTTNEIGISIPDILGTAKISGNLLFYGGERNEAVTQEVGGGGGGCGIDGGGGSQTQVTGHRYYMSWAIGICAGPVDEILTIFRNEDVVWSGNTVRPGSGGEETIVITDMGSVTFYFGTDDQAANASLGALMDDATLNTPYRGLCWAFFDDCYIGDYNRMPTMRFVLRKTPVLAFSASNIIQYLDYNPAHTIWCILHDLTGLPETWLHEADFADMAETLYGESRGISLLMDSQQSVLNYLESINSHIDAIVRYGGDGKFHPKLIRDDYTVGDLPLIDETVVLDDPAFSRKSWIDTLNEMKVQYTEITLGETLQRNVYIFTESGQFTMQNDGTVEVLIVAGGGGGGRASQFSWQAGGGAAGGVIYEAAHALAAGEYQVTVGLGGWNNPTDPMDGNPSVFDTLTALGGGYGGGMNVGWGYPGHDGGSGGGGCRLYPGPGEGEPGQGYDGAAGGADSDCGGAGGGAGGPASGINGGDGFACAIIDGVTPVYYAGGGASASGGIDGAAGTPGLGGGGEVSYGHDGGAGDPNTGSGGGAGWGPSILYGGGPGGKGIVIIAVYEPVRGASEVDLKQSTADPVAVDIGNKEIQDRVVSKTIQMALFTMNENAVWAGINALRKESYPFAVVSFPANRNAFRLEVGDCFKFSYARYGISNMICRVLQISEEGPESETITVQAMEDIFSIANAVTTFAAPTSHAVPAADYTVSPLTHQKIIEAPYVISTDIKLLPIACRESEPDLGYDVYMSIDGGASYSFLQRIPSLQPYGTLVGSYLDDTYTIDDLGLTIDIEHGASLIETTTFDQVLAGLKNTALLGDEIISFQTITPVSGTQYKLEHVIRGRYDTIKESHSEGAKFYCLPSGALQLITSTEFIAGAARKFKFVPYNIKKSGAIAEATALDLTVAGRALTPYMPGNLCANGSATAARYDDDIVLTWSPRYRGKGAGLGLPGLVLPETDREGLFKVEVYVAAALVRTESALDAATWTYTEAMNIADNGSAAAEAVLKVSNYRAEGGNTYESDQAEVTCKLN